MSAQTATPTQLVGLMDTYTAALGLAGYSDLVREVARLQSLATDRYALLIGMASDITAAALNLEDGGQTNIESAAVQMRAAAVRLYLALQSADARADLGPLPENVSVLALARAARRHRAPAPAA